MRQIFNEIFFVIGVFAVGTIVICLIAEFWLRWKIRRETHASLLTAWRRWRGDTHA